MLCAASLQLSTDWQNSAAHCKDEINVFAPLKRLVKEPVLSPRKSEFDCAGAFNPTCARLSDGRTIMLYRGQDDKGVSRIGIAQSKDGIHFVAEKNPVLSPQLDDESKGIEDPRLFPNPEVKDEWLLTATAYSVDAQLALYKSKDLKQWQRVGIIMPAKKGKWNINWTKSGALVPQKINGKFWMYYMGDTPDGCNQMGLASSSDLVHWEDASTKPVLPVRPSMFDSRVVEPGPAPIITKDGILLLYNGANDKLCYQTGWALFDKNNPSRLIARSEVPIFEPVEPWEIKNSSSVVHQAPNVVFVEGLVENKGRYMIYYGAADSYVGVAETKLVQQK